MATEPEITDLDREVDALGRIWDCLSNFSHDAQLRMVEYLQNRVAEQHRVSEAEMRGKGLSATTTRWNGQRHNG